MPSTDDLETRLAFLAAAVDASEDAVLCLDRDSRLTRWNAQAQRLFGADRLVGIDHLDHSDLAEQDRLHSS